MSIMDTRAVAYALQGPHEGSTSLLTRKIDVSHVEPGQGPSTQMRWCKVPKAIAGYVFLGC